MLAAYHIGIVLLLDKNVVKEKISTLYVGSAGSSVNSLLCKEMYIFYMNRVWNHCCTLIQCAVSMIFSEVLVCIFVIV